MRIRLLQLPFPGLSLCNVILTDISLYTQTKGSSFRFTNFLHPISTSGKTMSLGIKLNQFLLSINELLTLFWQERNRDILIKDAPISRG